MVSSQLCLFFLVYYSGESAKTGGRWEPLHWWHSTDVVAAVCSSTSSTCTQFVVFGGSLVQ